MVLRGKLTSRVTVRQQLAKSGLKLADIPNSALAGWFTRFNTTSTRRVGMVGFTEPNQYEPRAGWRLTLAQWVLEPPAAGGSWRQQIREYWRWRTVDGMSLGAAWEELSMTPDSARSALDPGAPNSGLIPPELFSRVLARSRAADIDPDDNVDDVTIAPTPSTELPDHPEVGFTPARTNPARPAIYQPRAAWQSRLLAPPGNAANWLAELGIYWRKRTEQHKTPEQAWAELDFHHTNAATSLNKDLADRGSIPPEIIGRVVARSQSQPPGANVEGIILYPELTV